MMKIRKGVLPLSIVFILVVIYMFFAIKNKRALDKNHRYTTGNVYKHMYLVRSSESIYFKFKYKNKDYSSSSTGNKLKETVGRSYIIKFNPEDPENCEILLDKEVSQEMIPPSERLGKTPR